MSAYLLYLCRSVEDRKELETYWAEIGPTLAGSGAENMAAYTRFEVLEAGEKATQNVEGVVLTRFPSKEAAKAWYDSPGYTEVRKHRMKGAKYLGLVIDGGWLPVDERMPESQT